MGRGPDSQSFRVSSVVETLAPAEEQRVERRMVELAIEGDTQAFRWIVERHTRGLFGLCLRTVGDRAEAEDLVQTTFARAARRLDTFDPAYRLSTWLYRIALNACRDYLKSPRRNERPSGADARELLGRPSPDDAPDDAHARREDVARVRRALDELSPSYREILVLKDLEELSYQEIREITGVPITALKIRAIRARAKLAAVLGGES